MGHSFAFTIHDFYEVWTVLCIDGAAFLEIYRPEVLGCVEGKFRKMFIAGGACRPMLASASRSSVLISAIFIYENTRRSQNPVFSNQRIRSVLIWPIFKFKE